MAAISINIVSGKGEKNHFSLTFPMHGVVAKPLRQGTVTMIITLEHGHAPPDGDDSLCDAEYKVGLGPSSAK